MVNDDTRRKNTKKYIIVSSCDSGFGAIILPDGTFYLGCPRDLYDSIEEPNTDIELYAKGICSKITSEHKLPRFTLTEVGQYKFNTNSIL